MSDERRRHLLALLLVAAGLIATKPVALYYDFTTYHVAGLLLLEGTPERAFDTEALDERFQRTGRAPHLEPGAFLYSPLYLLPAALTATLDYEDALVVNQLATLVALVGLLHLILRRTVGWGLKACVCAAFLLAHTVGVQFIYQNWSFLLVLLVALAWAEARAGRVGVAAVLWALAIHLKLFAVFFLAPMALTGGRRLVALTAIATIVLAGLALPWVGVSSYRAYGESLAELSTSGVQPFYNKVSLQAAAARFLTRPWDWIAGPPEVRHPAVRVVPWIGLGLWLPLLYRLRRDPDAALFLTVPFALLFIPRTWDHSQLLLFVLFLCPTLSRHALFLLAALLAASAAYGPAVRQLMVAALEADASPTAVRIALLFYPMLDLLAVAMLWETGRAAPRPSSEGSRA